MKYQALQSVEEIEEKTYSRSRLMVKRSELFSEPSVLTMLRKSLIDNVMKRFEYII